MKIKNSLVVSFHRLCTAEKPISYDSQVLQKGATDFIQQHTKNNANVSVLVNELFGSSISYNSLTNTLYINPLFVKALNQNINALEFFLLHEIGHATDPAYSLEKVLFARLMPLGVGIASGALIGRKAYTFFSTSSPYCLLVNKHPIMMGMLAGFLTFLPIVIALSICATQLYIRQTEKRADTFALENYSRPEVGHAGLEYFKWCDAISQGNKRFRYLTFFVDLVFAGHPSFKSRAEMAEQIINKREKTNDFDNTKSSLTDCINKYKTTN